jgi:hypothetical protein
MTGHTSFYQEECQVQQRVNELLNQVSWLPLPKHLNYRSEKPTMFKPSHILPFKHFVVHTVPINISINTKFQVPLALPPQE